MKKKYLLLILLLFLIMLVGCTTPTIDITSIVIEADSIEIEVGEDSVIPITYDGKGDYSDLDFSISDESVVSVDKNFISGTSAGITTLTISSKKDSSINDKIDIIVNPEGFKKEFEEAFGQIPNDEMIEKYIKTINTGKNQ